MLDVNCELWRVKVGEKIVLTLLSSLDGEVDDGTYKSSTEGSLLDMVGKRKYSRRGISMEVHFINPLREKAPYENQEPPLALVHQ